MDEKRVDPIEPGSVSAAPKRGLSASDLAYALALGFAYFLIGRASLLFRDPSQSITAFWPANGFAAALLAACPPARRIASLIALFAAGFTANALLATPAAACAGMSLANAAEIALAAHLIDRLARKARFLGNVHDTVHFLLPITLISSAVGCLLGGLSVSLFLGAGFAAAARTWFIVDAVGLAVVTPAVLAWRFPDPDFPRSAKARLEFSACLSASLIGAWIVFARPVGLWEELGKPFPYATFPFLLWAAMRFGPRGASTAHLLVYTVAAWFTCRGEGPFHLDPSGSIFESMPLFPYAAAFCSLVPAVLIRSHRAIESELRNGEARYGTLWNSKLVGVCVMDLHGRVKEANESFLRMIDSDHAALQAGAIDMSRMLPPETSAEEIARNRRRFVEDGYFGPFERDWILADGRRMHALVFSTRLERADQAMVMVMDIGELKRAREEARTYESRYRSLLASRLIGVYNIEKGGLVTEANDAFLSMLGYTRAELEAGGLNTLRLSTPEYRERAEMLREKLYSEGQIGPLEREWVLRDGSIKRTLLFMTRNPDQESSIGMVMDIEELRKAQEELSFSRNRFQSLMDSNIVGIGIMDQDGLFVEANQAYLDMVGYERADIEAGRLLMRNLVPESQAEQAREIKRKVRAEGKLDSQEGFYLRKDGRIVNVFRGAIRLAEASRLMVAAVDVTYLRETQQALRQSEHLFRSLAEASPVGTLRLDAQGRCLYANPKWLEMTGLGVNGIHGMGWTQGISPADRDRIVAAWNAFVKGGPPVIGEYRLVRPNGTITWVSAQSTQVVDEEGKVLGYLEKTVDITARRLAEAKLEEAKIAAEAANDAKSEFLATISHEIRTPLNGVMGMMSLLLETPLSAEQRGFAKTSLESGEHLLALINQILDFSKIERGHLELASEPFDLAAVVEGAFATVGDMAQKKGLSLAWEKAPGLAARFVGDPLRLQQVLLNLIGNAVKFSDHGAIRLTIASEPAEETSKSAQEASKSAAGKSRLRFEVSDQGPGMKPEILAGLFQRFRQGDASLSRKAGGTGLGLAICKSLVERMGGSIWVESTLGEGSRFGFTAALEPVAEAASAEAAVAETAGAGAVGAEARANANGLGAPMAEPAPSAAEVHPIPGVAPAKAPKILVVDDHPVNLTVASAMLRKLKCQVDTAADGPEAIAACKARAYDLIFMDCQMPDMDGFETTRRLRALEAPGKKTPIVALTAHAVTGVREKCLAAGMDDYISKPFDAATLRKALSAWTNGSGGPARKAWDGHAADPARPSSLDLARLRALEHPEGDVIVKPKKLVDLFLETSRASLASIRAQARGGESEALAKSLHRLRGSCMTLGALGMGGMVADLEARLKSGSASDLAPDLDALEREFSDVSDRLGEYLGSTA